MTKIKILLVLALLLTPTVATAQLKIIISTSSVTIDGNTYEQDTLVISPSYGIDVLQLNLRTREYQAGVAFSAGYGIRWSPTFYGGVLVALDLFISAGLQEADNTIDNGPDFISMALLPTLSILNGWISFGLGVQHQLALRKGEADLTSGLIAIGVKTFN